jgi:cytochrome P450
MAGREYLLSRSAPLDPPEMLRELRRLPISKVTTWGGSEVWVATRYEDVNFVLRDPRFSSDVEKPGFPPVSTNKIDTWRYISSIGHMDDPRHGEIRRILAEDFLPKRIDELRPKFEQIAMTSIDRILAASPPVDLHTAFALWTSARVVNEVLDMPVAYRQLFEEKIDILLTTTTPIGEQISAVLAEMYASCARLLQQDETETSDSLFARIKSEVRNGKLDLDEACRTIVNLTCVGHGITASSISLGTLMLLLNPGLFNAMREESDAAHNILEELLRYHSPINYGLPRIAVEDVRIGETLISKGDGILISLSSANRDDSVFDDPDKFDITRTEARRHLSFGNGAHVCLGQWLARAELQIALSALVTRIPTLRLAVPLEEISFTEEAYIFTVNELPVTW